ncbi:hypothetical protein DKX38_011471 [Salix brachista]|uniref:A20-type domain-containing protein n=1 Tax=Salix brachista TaxID=2182728 RepID=A0A5N5LYS3_9ROSI|nr:hypothetical protein DKX38_011471 [Salix brachista]
MKLQRIYEYRILSFLTPSTDNLCSKCYKEFLLTQPETTTTTIVVPVHVAENSAAAAEVEGQQGGAEEKRPHRYSDKHNCVFDYKSAGQDAIAKANPVVKADKIDKI